MAGFDAGSVVEKLEWNFRPYVNAKGVIDEPTDAQISTFFASMKAMTEGLKGQLPEGVDTDDPGELIAALDELDAGLVVTINQELAGIYTVLCSGSPTREQLLGLPMRVRAIFYNWLQREVMSPEAAAGAGSAQVTTLRRAAAG